MRLMQSKGIKKMKVFHGLVNYGTQAGLFAKALREMGIESLSVTYPDPFKRQIDIELLHGGNIIQKIIKHSWNYIRRFYWFFKFNIFHFYYGTSLFPKQFDLPLYKFFGKKVLMEYLGYDVQLYQYSIEKYKITNVSHYYLPEISILSDKKKLNRLKFERKFLNKQIVCAPYISEFVPGSIVLPLAIDLREFKYHPAKIPINKVLILHAPTNRGNKGTEYIIDAIQRLINENYQLELILAENLTHDELKLKYVECDIFIDQLLSGWYGTAAIEAMAIGRPTIAFIRESYKQYIDYGEDIPIINANPESIYEVLIKIMHEKQLLPEIGRKSREFVEKIHDLRKVTTKIIELYKSL